MNLKEAVKIRQSMVEYQDTIYLNLVQQTNSKCKDILKDDLGQQFVQNCGRDIAGEVVRSYFDTSDYSISVDQMARRMFEFEYKDDFDPLNSNDQLRKSIYENKYNSKETLSNIIEEIDSNQVKLFNKVDGKYEDQKMIKKNKDDYAESKKDENDIIIDEYTGQEGEYVTDSSGRRVRRQEVEHTQSLSAATYNEKYLKEKGVSELKAVLNSNENFEMMHKSANSSKGDVKVYEKDKNGNEIKDSSGNKIDITHKATPEQYADAVCKKWENANNKETLKEKGYLNEDGTVPESVRKKLEQNIKKSQNAESKVILKNAEYGTIAKDAAKETAASIGKMIAGQLIYYGAPPLFYEVKKALKEKHNGLDDILNKITRAGKRIGKYLLSKMKDMFKTVAFNSLKKFVKTFMDILINLLKATIKKMVKMAKTVVMSTIDAVKVIANKETSRAEKADAVTNLYAMAVTNIVVEILFELIEKGLKIPEWMLKPLQLLTSVVSTNLVMLILKKADLFNVQLGFKMNKIRSVFEDANKEYDVIIKGASQYTDQAIQQIIAEAKNTSIEVYSNLTALDPYNYSVKNDLKKVSDMFNMNIQFDDEWLSFIGLKSA